MTKRDLVLSVLMLVALGLIGYGLFLAHPAACYCFAGGAMMFGLYKAVNHGKPSKPPA